MFVKQWAPCANKIPLSPVTQWIIPGRFLVLPCELFAQVGTYFLLCLQQNIFLLQSLNHSATTCQPSVVSPSFWPAGSRLAIRNGENTISQGVTYNKIGYKFLRSNKNLSNQITDIAVAEFQGILPFTSWPHAQPVSLFLYQSLGIVIFESTVMWQHVV